MPLGPASGGGGGNAGDVRAGGAYIEVSAKDRLTEQITGFRLKAVRFVNAIRGPLFNLLPTVEKRMQQLSAGLQTVGRAGAMAGAATLAPLTALFGAGANRAAEVERMADQLGFTVEQMQRLKFAADAAGVSVEDVLRAPEKYGDLMNQASVLDAATIRQAAKASRELAGAWINLQSALVPVVQIVGPLVSQFAKFAQTNPVLVRSLALGAAGLTAVGVGLLVAGKGLAAFTVLGRAAVLSLDAVFFAVARLSLGTALFVGFGAAFGAALSGWGQLAGDLGTAFDRMGQTFGATMKGITDAIQKGDFESAFKIFTTGVEAVWYEMILNMAKAFGTFIDNNRDRLLALGALMGGLQGAKLGGRFGPWGALLGGAGGALGGGVAVDQLAKLVEGIANNTGLEEKRIDVQRRLAELNKQAAGPVAAAAEDPEKLAKRIVATRGAFRLLGDASQQFGRNDSIESKQLAQLVEIKKTLDKQTQLQIDAMNMGRFK